MQMPRLNENNKCKYTTTKLVAKIKPDTQHSNLNVNWLPMIAAPLRAYEYLF